jgi:hypothetical protein
LEDCVATTSLDYFLAATIQTGVRPDGRILARIMPWRGPTRRLAEDYRQNRCSINRYWTFVSHGCKGGGADQLSGLPQMVSWQQLVRRFVLEVELSCRTPAMEYTRMFSLEATHDYVNSMGHPLTG